MNDNPVKPYMIGALITSAVGAVMLLVGDFGGWYYQADFGDQLLDRYGAIGLLSVYAPVIIVLAGLLIFAAYVSFSALRSDDEQYPASNIRVAYLGTLAVFIVMVVAAIIFTATMTFQETEDWWLDSGFYGGTLGAGLSALLLRLGLKQITS